MFAPKIKIYLRMFFQNIAEFRHSLLNTSLYMYTHLDITIIWRTVRKFSVSKNYLRTSFHHLFGHGFFYSTDNKLPAIRWISVGAVDELTISWKIYFAIGAETFCTHDLKTFRKFCICQKFSDHDDLLTCLHWPDLTQHKFFPRCLLIAGRTNHFYQ